MNRDTLWPNGQAYHSCGRCLPFPQSRTVGDQEALLRSVSHDLEQVGGIVGLGELQDLVYRSFGPDP